MDQLTKNKNNNEVFSFKTKDKVTVNVHGEPNFNMWAKKMLELYNHKLSTSAS